MTSLPLDGVRVLDLSALMACPMSTMYLADFGAEVIKIEHPVRGDEMRQWGRKKDGLGLTFKMVNRNKRLVTLDLGAERGRAIAKDLVAWADVVTLNYRHETVARWGLDYESLRALKPDVIALYMTGFGRTGPHADRPGFGSLVESYTGATYLNGFDDRPPLMAPFPLGDTSAALKGAFALMVALYHRERTGEGQEIDMSLYDGLFTMLGPFLMDYDQLGKVQERQGVIYPFVVPRGVFQTEDGGFVAISGSSQGMFRRVCEVLDIPELAADPRFAENGARIDHAEEIVKTIEAAARTLTRAEILARAERLDATIGEVNSSADLAHDPHMAARGDIASVADEDLGPLRMQEVRPVFSRTPGHVRQSAGRLGRDNEAVYRDLLGLTDADLRQLAADRVI
jgi:crotonobetainyl-CoA:carnitine CoA-transferase CaiB-like acyl-CoA transferase